MDIGPDLEFTLSNVTQPREFEKLLKMNFQTSIFTLNLGDNYFDFF